jgi:acetylornithine deacetylase
MRQIINLTKNLIKINTVQNNETEAINFIESFLSPLGFLSKRIATNRKKISKHPAYTEGSYSYTNRENGVFIFKGKRIKNKKKTLLFNAHSDVVPVGNIKSWANNPFKPQILDGKLFGRGTADTKGGLAALLIAVKELRKKNWIPDYDLIIEVVADEEGGGNGTLACMTNGIKADAAIFIEPVGVKNLFIGHRGGLKFCLTTATKGAQLKNRGKEGAVEMMATAINAVRKFAKEYAKIPPHPDYAIYDNPRPIYIGKIKGGDWFSSPALNCCLEGVIGWLPDNKEKEVKKLFKGYIKQFFINKKLSPPIIDFPQHHIEPCKTNPEEQIVNIAEKSIKTILKSNATVSCANFGTDMWIRNVYGKTPSVIIGPGGGNCHMPNEFIFIKELEQSKQIFKNILINW